MATEVLKRIRREITSLSQTERAELVDDLITSLDVSRQQGVAAAWEREILRRIELIDAGQAKLLDRYAFRRHMLDRKRT